MQEENQKAGKLSSAAAILVINHLLLSWGTQIRGGDSPTSAKWKCKGHMKGSAITNFA